MLDELKKLVVEANLELRDKKLVIYTWGNVSGIDRERGLIAIKPSGISYEELDINKIVIMDLEGRVIEGDLNPSSDTPTHLQLYKSFPDIGGVVHTHSPWATTWAQAGLDIPCYGTTHADYFYGDIPCTRGLNKQEIEREYEANTGRVIVERFKDIDYSSMPGVLVAHHAPFTWGKDPLDAVHNSVVLEEIAKMGFNTRMLNLGLESFPQELLDKHFLRKHGKDAYYGQKPSD